MTQEIMVFGSNLAGVHGAGAARHALEQHGARYGQGMGLQGSSYALPTKDHRIRTLPLEEIQQHVRRFLAFTEIRRDLMFRVTRVGCGLAGYRDEQIAPLFREALELPNVRLPQGWRQLILTGHADYIGDEAEQRP